MLARKSFNKWGELCEQREEIRFVRTCTLVVYKNIQLLSNYMLKLKLVAGMTWKTSLIY